MLALLEDAANVAPIFVTLRQCVADEAAALASESTRRVQEVSRPRARSRSRSPAGGGLRAQPQQVQVQVQVRTPTPTSGVGKSNVVSVVSARLSYCHTIQQYNTATVACNNGMQQWHAVLTFLYCHSTAPDQLYWGFLIHLHWHRQSHTADILCLVFLNGVTAADIL
jgi:hypothetical protein